jgi:hypothetical protein
MKKTLFLLSALFIFACSSDDSSDNSNDISIIGKWYVVKYEFYEDGVLDNVDNVKQYETNGCRSYFELKSDYTLEFATYFSDCSGFDGQTFGTWEMLESTNQLRLNYNSGAFDWTILTFDENNLTIEIEDCDNIGCVKDVNFYER